MSALNSALQTGLRSPMDEAILRHQPADLARFQLRDEIPFDFQRRRVSVVVEEGAERLLIAKGAPESVLGVCSAMEVSGKITPLSGDALAAAEELFRRLSSDGYRVLAVACRPVDPKAHYGVADEGELRLLGFAAFLDPPRDGVVDILAALKADGVEVKIITGDNELVTQHICRKVGLAADRILLGEDVERMSDPALAKVAEGTQVF